MEQNVNLKKNVMWNSIGSLYYLGIQWLTTVLVVRISGNYEDAGLYSLAISITNIFYMIAMYNVRNFQVSDTKGVYREGDYLAHRVTTMVVSMLACILFMMIAYRDVYTIGVVVCYMLFKVGESLVDVLHGMDQKVERMDIIGKSYLIRGTVMILTFVGVEALTKNLLVTVIVMSLATIIVAFCYDVRATRKLVPFVIEFRWDKIKRLYIDCFSFLIYGISMNMIGSIPRIIMEKMHGQELLGYYASVATPAVIVQSLANVIFVPFIIVFTRYYDEKDAKSFGNLAGKMIAFCLALGSVAYVGSFLFGRFLIENLLYQDPSIGPYCYLLNSTMICTMLVAIIWLLAIFMTIDRANVLLSFASVAGVVVEIVLSILFIQQDGIDGINKSLIFTYVIVISLMGIAIWKRYSKYFRK